MGGIIKRLLICILLALLAAALLLPAARGGRRVSALDDAADAWPRPEWSGYPVVDTSELATRAWRGSRSTSSGGTSTPSTSP